MVCQVCHRISPRWLCKVCLGELRPAPDRILPGGIRLIAAFEHEGPAKALIHNLKYRGVATYADLVADTLADCLPKLPVVPVPRALSRLIKYGVDPASILARRLGARLGAPALRLLASPLHTPRRAGGDHSRSAQGFRVRIAYPGEVILVDDVVTSGATISAAIVAIGTERVRLAVSANAALSQTSSRARRPSDSASS